MKQMRYIVRSLLGRWNCLGDGTVWEMKLFPRLGRLIKLFPRFGGLILYDIYVYGEFCYFLLYGRRYNFKYRSIFASRII